MRKLIKAIFLILALCFFGSSVYALSCSWWSSRPLSLSQNWITFIGSVVDIVEGVRTWNSYQPAIYTFEIDEVVKWKLELETINLTEAIRLNQTPCLDPIEWTKYIVNTSDGVTMDLSHCSCSYANLEDYSTIELKLLKSGIPILERNRGLSLFLGFRNITFLLAFAMLWIYIVVLLISLVLLYLKYNKQKMLEVQSQTRRKNLSRIKKISKVFFIIFIALIVISVWFHFFLSAAFEFDTPWRIWINYIFTSIFW